MLIQTKIPQKRNKFEKYLTNTKAFTVREGNFLKNFNNIILERRNTCEEVGKRLFTIEERADI